MHGDRYSVFRRYLRVSRAGVRAVALGAILALPVGEADAARGGQERIQGFGPFSIGMPRDTAKAANPRAKEQDCGEIASDRQCVALKAAVFEEPAVIFAVLDEAGAKVERIVAELVPELTRRRGFRCVRMAEKVFALLVVVYGPDYKQSYDEDRRPLPAVAWDGQLEGRLVFEAKCKTSDEGKPRITVIEYYPDGVKPPPMAQEAPPAPVAQATQVPPGPSIDASAPPGEDVAIAPTVAQPAARSAETSELTLVPADGEAPVPLSAPIGVVEQIAPGAPDTSGATDANSALAALTRELKIARTTPELDSAPVAPETPAAASAGPEGDPAAAPSTPTPSPGAGSAAEPSQSPRQQSPVAEGRGSPTVAVDVSPPTADTAAAAPDTRDLRPQGSSVAAAPPERTAPAVAETTPAVESRPTPPVTEKSDGGTGDPRRPEPQSTEQAPATTVASLPPAQQTQTPPVTDQGAAPTAARQTAAPAPAPKAPGTDQKPAAVAALTYRRPVPVVGPTVRPPSYGDDDAYPLPTDLEAPEPFMVPEEEELFRQRREATGTAAVASAAPTLTAEVERRLAASPPTASATPSPPPAVERKQLPDAARAPISLFSKSPDTTSRPASGEPPATARDVVARPSAGNAGGRTAVAPVDRPAATAPTQQSSVPQRTEVAAAPADTPTPRADSSSAAVESGSVALPASDAEDQVLSRTAFPDGWGNAELSDFTPVDTGGWRRRAPVPPAKPWRVRETSALETESDV